VGFNFNGIAAHTAVPPFSPTVLGLDGANHALFESGLAGTTGGLPPGGLFTFTALSNTYTFQLAPYGSTNLLQVNRTGTLTMTSPQKVPTLAVLGFSASGGAGGLEAFGDATLNFSDNSSSVYSRAIDLSNWTGVPGLNPNITTISGGMVNVTTGAFQATPPNVYVSLVTLNAADAAKTLTSVTISNFPFGGSPFQFVMALAGGDPPPPLPPTVPALSSWALAALGVLLACAAALALRPARA
jgi:hypothetical protein